MLTLKKHKDSERMYEVGGLPKGEAALVAEINGQWQVLRESKGERGIWSGQYPDPDKARESLELVFPAKPKTRKKAS